MPCIRIHALGRVCFGLAQSQLADTQVLVYSHETGLDDSPISQLDSAATARSITSALSHYESDRLQCSEQHSSPGYLQDCHQLIRPVQTGNPNQPITLRRL